ncbi:MAG TPA: AAA family ATPase, partial [Agromyces mariniharenae]|nr:AAA family ATPase [Agromyces mariniharenae]
MVDENRGAVSASPALDRELLDAKFSPPPRRPGLASRRALIERAAGSGARVVAVTAPAGYGKTTLLAEWLTAGDEPPPRVAWLSLDEGDNDPRRFLAHLVASVDAGVETSTLLETSGELPTDAVLTGLVNDLDQLDGTTVLVLDDYHVITEPAVHDAVAFLLEHLPPRA